MILIALAVRLYVRALGGKMWAFFECLGTWRKVFSGETCRCG